MINTISSRSRMTKNCHVRFCSRVGRGDLPDLGNEKFLDSFVEAVMGAMKKGDDVTLVTFGTFSIANRAERTGRNFKTGKNIQIPASKSVKFKAGKTLKNMVK